MARLEEMPIRLRPLSSHLIVKPAREEEVTAGGIILPETARKKLQEGIVLAAGPGLRDRKGIHISMDIREGDRVLFAKYAGTKVKLGTGYKVLVLKEDDILAIIG